MFHFNIFVINFDVKALLNDNSTLICPVSKCTGSPFVDNIITTLKHAI